MQYSVAYDKALEIGKALRESLLQRLNFFLIGTSFLIVGMATLVASNDSGGLTNAELTLAYVINALGLYLALFFTMVSFFNLLISGDFEEYIYALEERLRQGADDAHITELLPASKVKEIVDSRMKCFPWLIVRELLTEVYGLCTGQQSAVDVAKTNHAYLVSILFVLGWTVVFFLVLPWHWVATVAVFGLIGFVPVIWSLRYWKRSLRWSKQKMARILARIRARIRARILARICRAQKTR